MPAQRKQVNIRLGALALRHLNYLRLRWGLSESMVITVLLERAGYAESQLQAAEGIQGNRRRHAINRAKAEAAKALSMFFDVPALDNPDSRSEQIAEPEEWDEV